MAKQFLKGNEAVVKGAVLAGCQSYYGYPITPASEIAHAAALYIPAAGGTFVQAESEVAAINMVYGAASAGDRVMTASSGPGISLKQEGISYCAGSELPCVIVDVMRGGPDLATSLLNKATITRSSKAAVTAIINASCWHPIPCRKCAISACSHSNWPTSTATRLRADRRIYWSDDGTGKFPRTDYPVPGKILGGQRHSRNRQ
jgi:hypothetical protein